MSNETVKNAQTACRELTAVFQSFRDTITIDRAEYEVLKERTEIDHVRQLAYWKVLVKHGLCDEVENFSAETEKEYEALRELASLVNVLRAWSWVPGNVEDLNREHHLYPEKTGGSKKPLWDAIEAQLKTIKQASKA